MIKDEPNVRYYFVLRRKEDGSFVTNVPRGAIRSTSMEVRDAYTWTTQVGAQQMSDSCDEVVRVRAVLTVEGPVK